MERKEAGPWRLLPGALGLALSPTGCLIAALGLVVQDLGLRAIDQAFPGTPSISAVSADLQAVDAWMLSHADDPVAWVRAAARLTVEPTRSWLWPFRTVLDRSASGPEAIHGALAGAWGLVVWSILGAAIARRTVVRLTGSPGESGLIGSLTYAGRRAGSLAIASVAPVLVFGLIALMMAAIGVVLRHSGAWLAGLLGFMPTLAGLAMAVLVLVLAGCWPLMVSAVAAENEDGFDALSRAVSYGTQGPLVYVYNLVASVVLGIVGASAVAGFVLLAFGLEGWGLTIGSDGPSPIGSMPIWPGLVRLLALGAVFAYPWAAWPVVYLMLRRRVDGPDWDEIAS